MNRLYKVLAYLKEMNFKPDMDDFQNKLIIQKTVCLLELMDDNLGYPFSLYVRGPYSPQLTKELYENKDLINNPKIDYTPTEKEKKQLSKLYEISDHLNPNMLEIMCTYGYLKKSCKNDEKTAIINLKRLKSFYSESKLAIGISKAKQLFLKLNKKELEEIKGEFEAWENASVSYKNE